jgi:hypothetical protein
MLGAPVRVHTATLLGAALAAGGCVLLALGLWWLALMPDAPRAVSIAAIAFTAFTVWSVASTVRDATLRVTAYEQGIAWTRAGKRAEIHFEDIARIRVVGATLAIAHRDGRHLVVSSNVTERLALLAHLGLAPPELPTARVRPRS